MKINKTLDELTKEELLEEYNKLSDYCGELTKEYHKIINKLSKQGEENVALLLQRFEGI